MKMTHKNQKHEFALYWHDLSEYIKQYSEHSLFQITDQHLVHRIVSVLRLKQEDAFVLFDKHKHVHVELGSSTKKQCIVEVKSIDSNKLLQPKITFGLPLLKREAFENALYSLVECGVTAIQPIVTTKVHKASWSEKESERAKKIVIAASEQSKQYAIPDINSPVVLSDFVRSFLKTFTDLVFFDPEGQPLGHYFKNIEAKSHDKHFFLLIGPEWDLTQDEKELLKKTGFVFLGLTPTIVRAQQAASLSAGIFRALL